MPITLAVTGGPHAGRVFTLDRHDTFLVGRSSAAHLSLPDDPYFSRHHLLIEANPPLCQLTDLNSRNGTFVNGARVAGVDLRHGDEVGGGHTTIRVSVVSDPAAGATQPHPAAAPDDPPRITGFRDWAEVGRGGMGVVYRVVREADGRVAAVKTIRPALAPAPAEVERFLREVRVLRALAHPRVVAFHDAGEANGFLYLVMDFVEGTDARRLVHDRGPLPLPVAADLTEQLCDGLAYAHEKGFVHRDVKPANLLLAPRPGGGWDLRLADFGLAKAYQGSTMSGLTVSGACGGTPRFMPPEQVIDFASAKPPADQYAAGATLYFLLTGRYPFGDGQTPEVLRRVLGGLADRVESHRPDLPAAVATAVHRALAVRAEDRFGSVGEFAAAVRRGVKVGG